MRFLGRWTPIRTRGAPALSGRIGYTVTVGGVAYNTWDLKIVENTGGEASPLDFAVTLPTYTANPTAKGAAVTVTCDIAGTPREWTATVETLTFSGTAVMVHCLQGDAYLSRKICTGDEASADLGQNLADFVTSYGSPLTGTNIDTATGVTMALTGGYKTLNEHIFTDALAVLPEYIGWVEGTDIHFVDAASGLDATPHTLYESDPSAVARWLWFEAAPPGSFADQGWSLSVVSGNGLVFLAGVTGGRLYMSTDTGVTWTETRPAGDVAKAWYCAAIDSDGSVMLAGVSNGRLYLTSNTASSWSEVQPAGAVNGYWYSLASDSDGSVLLAGNYGGRLYKSIDTGVNWSEVQPAGAADKNWMGQSVDADGSVMLAGVNGGRLYKSVDTGVNWSEVQPAGNADKNWRWTAMSSDGSVMLAGIYGGRLYKSIDTGVNWSEVQPAGDTDQSWGRKSVSSDGTIMLVSASDGALYMSTDTGVTWTSLLSVGGGTYLWSDAVVDSSGAYAIASAESGRIYVGLPMSNLPHSAVRILPDVSYSISTLEVANKVWVIVKNSNPVVSGSATNTTVDPIYADSPREATIFVESGDAAFCIAAATRHLSLRKRPRHALTGISVKLRDGLIIQRGHVIRVFLPRASFAGAYPVRRVEHDFRNSVTRIDLGEFYTLRDTETAILALGRSLTQLQKESAI